MKKKVTVTQSKTPEKCRKPKRNTVDDLLNIMARLRGPFGCPWDREQTEQTLKKFLIEEAYETLEAIEAGMPEALREELGDLLLQIVFLSRIAEEKGEFSFPDVVRTLAEKLIHRHPHVFPPSNDQLKGMMPKNAREVVKIWGIAKELEGKYAKRTSLLDGLPLALPALERTRRFSQRLSRAGIGRPDIEAAWKKIEGNIAELKKTNGRSSRRTAEEKLGDLLFDLASWAQSQDLSAEEALRKANRRFAERLRKVELQLRKKDKTLEKSSPEEIGHLWNMSKKNSSS